MTSDYLQNAEGKRILVVGDIMLDIYEYGISQRINPESPASPLLHSQSLVSTLGGAANVANNLRALGASVSLYGLVGKDADGEQLERLLSANNIEHHLFSDGRPTTAKIRFVEQTRNHQVLRLDREVISPLAVHTLFPDVLKRFFHQIVTADAVVFSDYVKGVFTRPFAQQLLDACHIYSVPTLVDTKPSHLSYFSGCTALKPNIEEAEKMTNLTLDRSLGLREHPQLTNLCKTLRSVSNSDYAFITYGKEGLIGIDPQDVITIAPTAARRIYDVTGAGDTVMAVLALGFAGHYETKTLALPELMRLANIAGGIVVGKPGTSTVSLEELLSAAETS